MDTTNTGQQWQRDTTKLMAISNQRVSAIQPIEIGGLEVNQLSRYALVVMVITVCTLMSTWTRIDYRETAVALDRTQSQYMTALTQQARLELELATLSDPTWVQSAASNLSFNHPVTIVDIETRGE